MFDRSALHAIVDALPDESLDAAFRVLEHYQNTHQGTKAIQKFWRREPATDSREG